jgi:hypothetical protein
VSSAHACDEDLIRRLPLPLAQLYRRAHNAETPFQRHQAAYYLWEATLKLLGTGAIMEYAARGASNTERNSYLVNLARPALGHWWEFVRQFVAALADAGDAGFARVCDLLLRSTYRDDLPRAAGLDAALREVLEGRRAGQTRIEFTKLIDRLVHYRNRKVGHAAVGLSPEAFYNAWASPFSWQLPSCSGGSMCLPGDGWST